MKRMTIYLLALLILVATLPLNTVMATGATAGTTPTSAIGSQIAPSMLTLQKTVHNSKDYLPLRQTFEALGYQVSWEEANKTVSIDKGTFQITFRPNDAYFLKDGVLKDGKIAPIMLNNKVYFSVASAYQIFTQVQWASKAAVSINPQWRAESKALPKLKNKFEFDKLQSFYPSQQIYYSMRLEGAPAAEATAVDSAKGADENADVSQTNNQVSGVDESDIQKLDANFLYTIKNNAVQIFKLGRQDLGLHLQIEDPMFFPSQLFITKDYLITIGTETRLETQVIESEKRIGIMPIYHQQPLMVRFYKISDLASKKIDNIMSYGVEGNFVAARMIDNYIYLVANQYSYYGPMVSPMLYQKSNQTKLVEQPLPIDNMSYFPGQGSNMMLYTVGIDLNQLNMTGLDVKTYLGGAHTAYATANALYLAGQTYSGMWWRESSQKTELYGFDLDKGKVNFRAKGSVPGTLINQFSMDEHNGFFRVATTSWQYNEKTNEQTTSNDLYILDKQMAQVGQLSGLAPGERIYSTRFIGDRVYMVTFRQVDPFYVIDASKPQAPSVMGYLKIPGYSSYLHPYDDKTIIGIGMETEAIGERVINAGVKISLFDVSDFNNPIEKDKMIIGKGNSYTDVSWDHKAFLFNKNRNIMAMPIMAQGENGQWSTQDAYIFSFTADGKLNQRGKISHATGAIGTQAPDYSYWEEYISRIFYVNQDLYTISNKWLQLNDFDTLSPINAVKR